jgi:3-phosphoshikimate 1-carboxyvinyltransferase
MVYNKCEYESTVTNFNKTYQAQIAVTGSKSETNRLLLLQALFPNITDNTSNSDDSEVMQMALNGTEELIDIHHAGTAMF